MSKFFKLHTEEIEQDISLQGSEMRQHYESKYLLSHFQKLKTLKEDLLRLPVKDEFFFLQTDRSFNAFTFIPFICEKQSIRHLYAATYSISNKVISALMELQNAGRIEEITLLISDSMIKRNAVVIDNLLSLANGNGNLNVLFAWTHAKVCIIETKTNHFIIEGSGNWSDNAHYEQYMFGNSKGLFDFRKELFTNSKLIEP